MPGTTTAGTASPVTTPAEVPAELARQPRATGPRTTEMVRRQGATEASGAPRPSGP